MDKTAHKLFYARLKKYTVTLLSIIMLPLVASAYTIDQAIQHTITTHPDILSEIASAQAAQSDIAVARGGLYPTVDISGGIGKETTDNPATRASGNHMVTLTRREGDAIIRQLLFDGGNVINQVVQNKANYVTSKFQINEAKELLAFQAAQAFLNVLRNQELMVIARRDVAAHQDLYEKVTKRFKAGAGRKSEVQLASSRLALAMSRMIRAQGLMRDAEDIYRQIIGLEPDKSLKLEKVEKTVPKSSIEAQRMAMLTSPTVAATESEIASKKAEIKIAKSEFWPTIALELSTTQQDQLDGVVGHNNDYQAMLRMNYNIFNGGSDKASVSAASQRAVSAQHDSANVRRTVKQDVALSWNDLQAEINRVPYLKQHKDESYNVSIAYTKQFKLGQRTLFDLLNSATEYFNSWSSYVDGVYDAKIARYRLLASIGILAKSTSGSTQHNIIAHKPLKRMQDNKKTYSAPVKKVSRDTTKMAGTTVAAGKTSTEAVVATSSVAAKPMKHASAKTTSTSAQKNAVIVSANPQDLARGDYYVVQLAAVHDTTHIKSLIEKNHLQGQVKFYHKAQKTPGKNDIHFVEYGHYSSKKEAEIAVINLPETFLSLNPTIINIKEVAKKIA